MKNLKELTYGYNEFDEVIDAATMEIHHSKHLAAYYANYNNLINGTKFEDMCVKDVIQDLNALDESIRTGVRNNGGGMLNHNLYFAQFKKESVLPEGKLKEKIEANKELGLLSKKLATIILDVPVDFNPNEFKFKVTNSLEIKEVFRELEFRRLIDSVDRIFKINKQEKELEIAFNIHYLISVLEKLTADEINMVIPGGENKSCLLSATGDEGYHYIVMPMRI